MEGYPLNETTFSYVDDPVGAYQSSNLIETLSAHTLPEFNKESPKNIVKEVGNDLYTDLQGSFSEQVDLHDKDVLEHIELIQECAKTIENVSQKFRESYKKVMECEHKLKESAKETRGSLETVKKFSTFLNTIGDDEHEELQMMMVVLSEKIQNKDTTKEIKEKYQKELYILQHYLHNFVKPLNSTNVGNTCSLCLQKPVDTFMNPCGHTGCSECIDRLKELNGEMYQANCFMCRKAVNSFHKLYFC